MHRLPAPRKLPPCAAQAADVVWAHEPFGKQHAPNDGHAAAQVVPGPAKLPPSTAQVEAISTWLEPSGRQQQPA